MLKWIKKKLPDSATLKNHQSLKLLRSYLHYKYLWKLDVESVSRATAIGIFIGFLPVPLQMLWAALLALALRGNLPLSICITWFNNPFTFIPINYFIYHVGAWITGEKADTLDLPRWEWRTKKLLMIFHEFTTWLFSLGKTYFIGLAIVSIGSAVLGYFLTRMGYKVFAWFKKKK